jgi:cellulose synthase/poly-beta-1,6-N-acetylglucosamine synthase-like glycosyltransferase
VVAPGLLREHLASYTDKEIGGVLGLTDFTGKESLTWKIVERTSFHIPFSFARRMDYAPWGPCTNISFRREVLLRIQGFRSDLLFDFSGEDVDIGLRINKLGYKIKCNPRAIVYHSRETWSNLMVLCKKIFRWGRTGFHILTQHSYLSETDFPKFTTVSFLIIALAVLYGLLGLLSKMVGMLILWSVCVPTIYALLRSFGSKQKASDFLFNYLSFWLTSVYEFGSVYESIKNQSPVMVYKRHMYGSGQLLFEWGHRLIENSSLIISLIALVIFTLI